MISRKIFLIIFIPAIILLQKNGIIAQEVRSPSAWENNRNEILQILTQYASENNLEGFIHDDNKCGFWMSEQISEHWNNFSVEQRKRLKELLALGTAQVDTIIGNFRILYDTTGLGEPALLDENFDRIPHTARAYVDSVGNYLNYVWNYLIDTLGYESPPFQHGNAYYLISIEELGSTLYGETRWDLDEDLINGYNPPRYTSYIRIDNDYYGFIQSPGMAGMKVTLAHELFHAIQIGSYGIRSTDVFFYEISSTWMEDVLFTDVNDYYQYLSNSPLRRSQFSCPDAGFVRADGSIEYSRCVWGKFVEKKYSRDVMLSAWNYMRLWNAINALDRALLDRGSSFRTAFREWTQWNLNTGIGADTVKYYTEGRNYPLIVKNPVIVYSQTTRAFADTVDAISSIYQPVCVVQNLPDTCSDATRMTVTVMNINMPGAYSSGPFSFRYEMTPSGDNSYRKLSNGIYVRLEVPDEANWFAEETIPTITQEVIVYPNPYNGNSALHFNLPPVQSSDAILSVFSASMDRIYSSDIAISSISSVPVISWDGKISDGGRLSSGIYIYIISVDGKKYTGKFAVVRK
jgi:hypothetical protein